MKLACMSSAVTIEAIGRRTDQTSIENDVFLNDTGEAVIGTWRNCQKRKAIVQIWLQSVTSLCNSQKRNTNNTRKHLKVLFLVQKNCST